MDRWEGFLGELNAAAANKRDLRAHPEVEKGSEQPEGVVVKGGIRKRQGELRTRKAKVAKVGGKIDLKSKLSALKAALTRAPLIVAAKNKRKRAAALKRRGELNRHRPEVLRDEHEERLQTTALKGVTKFFQQVAEYNGGK